MNHKSNKSSFDTAFEEISKMLVDFKIHPGSRINEVDLSDRLGMSRAPIREALNRLIERGLVAFNPGKGFYCRKLSAKEVINLFEIRSDLEIAAAKKTCLHADKKIIDDFVEKWHRSWSLKYINCHDIDIILAADEDFHIELASLSGNFEKEKMLRSINERIRFVRKIYIESDFDYPKMLEGHQEIIKSISCRDSYSITKAFEKHFLLDSEILKKTIQYGLSKIYANDIE